MVQVLEYFVLEDIVLCLVNTMASNGLAKILQITVAYLLGDTEIKSTCQSSQ